MLNANQPGLISEDRWIGQYLSSPERNSMMNQNKTNEPVDAGAVETRSVVTRSAPTASGRQRHSGFTLVELLVVITIIGAIAALAIPAIGRVMRTVKQSAMQAEITNIDQGIGTYFDDHGDYPPDFSNWNIVKRHYLAIFPDIATSELTLLFRLCDNLADNDPNQLTATNNIWNPAAMDRAEAIVWSLGGFSSDPQYPFTGEGGPLLLLNPAGRRDDPANVQYNNQRSNSKVNFEPSRLSMTTPNASVAPSYGNRFASNDFDAFTSQNLNPSDVFPVYRLRDGGSPIVYFDARTYAYFDTNVGAYNGFLAPNNASVTGFDGVRPVYSQNPGYDPPGTNTYASGAEALNGWQFANAKTYQLIAPGIDGLFGELVDNDPANDPTADTPVYFQVGGNLLDPGLFGSATSPDQLLRIDVSRFDVTVFDPPAIPLSRSLNPFSDNMANFVDGRFDAVLD